MDLSAWGDVELVERIDGHRNEVWRARLDGATVSVRRSRRSHPSLEWELDLIGHLGRNGFRVPHPVPTAGGGRSHDGVVVQRWLDGRPPEGDGDWRRVADELVRLHTVTAQYPQRPGCATVTDLDRTGRSVDADIGVLPDDVAATVLAVFGEMSDVPVAVVHGDPGASNLRLTGDGRVGLLDFDEARVDLVWHDLSNLGVQVLDDESHARAQRLSNAWEAANAWLVEPDYARHRLAALTD